MTYLAILTALTAAFIAARFLFKLFFEDADDFWDCVRFSFTPDIVSMFRGEYFEDMAKSLKLACFLFLVGLSGVMAYWGVTRAVG